MKFRSILTVAAMVLLPFAASAATIVVPAAGTGPGANNSQWQSELTLHSAAPRALTVSISFHHGIEVLGPINVTLGARETLSIADIARTKFGLAGGTGALVIEVADRDARHLAVTSRTFNTTDEGEFGQDIPAVKIADAAVAGDIATLTGPSAVATTRFNFGIYAVEATTVKWELVRASGNIISSNTLSFPAGSHAQFNNGVQGLLHAVPQNNDTVYARVITGRAIFYGSAINATGDPTFVPSVRTRDDILIQFGIDEDEDGTVDLSDADGDGVLDVSMELLTGAFPNYFRIVAQGESGEDVQLAIVSSPSEAVFIDTKGTVLTAPFEGLKGQTGTMVVRATSGGTTTLLTIPLRFR